MKDYSYYLENIGEYGIVREVNYPIASVVGLPHVKPNEIVIFEKGEVGEIFSIDSEYSEVLIFSKNPVDIGEQLVRTDEFISTPVGRGLLGSIIDPLGRPIVKNKSLDSVTERRDVDADVKGIATRARIRRSFLTGTSVIDLLLPLGKGQRELIIGDRKTGKTALLLTTIKHQIQEGTVVIYAAIAKKKSEIKKLREFFDSEKLAEKTIIVASDPDDSPSLIFLTPYTAMSIAEYFRDIGIDTLVVFDDLSIHAKFYREVSLLSKRFPGRESYPGDIFYRHAKLLERAGNFKHKEKGEVSITALPIAETIEGDLAGYIATNLMGMTDGHIFFDSDVFYKGRRPAINIFLSVTRVGRQTQSALKREINRELTAFLANYEKMQTFSHFGAELSEKVKTILNTGEKLQTFLNQHYSDIIPEAVQVIILSLIWLHAFDNQSNEVIDEVRKKLIEAYTKRDYRVMFDKIIETTTFHDLLLRISQKKEELLNLVSTKSSQGSTNVQPAQIQPKAQPVQVKKQENTK